MPRYHKLGDIPKKRHTIFKDKNGNFLYEELFGTIGFDGMSSLLYHTQPPTAVKEIQNCIDISPKIAPFGRYPAIYLRDAEISDISQKILHQYIRIKILNMNIIH